MDKAMIMAKVQRRLAEEPDRNTPAELAALIREEAVVISDLDVLDIMRALRDETVGIGALEQLLALDGVTDICVNGPNGIFFDRGRGLERASFTLSGESEVRRLATRLASSCGCRLDDARPFADGHLSRDDGTVLRFHAVLSPTANCGTCMSLRVLRSKTATLDQIQASGGRGRGKGGGASGDRR